MPSLAFGCGMLKPHADQTPAVVSASEHVTEEHVSTPNQLTTMEPLEGANRNSQKSEKRTLAADEIRHIQARLKAAGFNPGPVDGIIGAKTMSAILRLQSVCSSLQDLSENSDNSAVLQNNPRRQTFRAMPASDRSPRNEEVRALQARLTKAGFNPGPVDGLIGPKMRSAIIQLESVCTILKGFPPEFQRETQSASNQPTAVKARLVADFEAPAAPVLARDGVMSRTVAAGDHANEDEIRLVQVRLKDAGFDPGPIDGLLGPRTRLAIERYRAAHATSGLSKLLSGIRPGSQQHLLP